MSETLVLYGTLRCGEKAFQQFKLIERLQFIKDVTFKGTLIDFGRWPGYLPEGNSIVYGEQYSIVDPALLAELDRHEDVDPADPGLFNEATRTGSMYLRKPITCTDGTVSQVYVYNGWILKNGQQAPYSVITSGDWITHIFSKR